MILRINGLDILPFVEEKGIKWTRNDIDGDDAGRTMDGTMHRARIASKIRLDISCIPLSSENASELLSVIAPEYVEVEYMDPLYGYVYKTMYSNNTPATYMNIHTDMWEGISFPLIER